MRPSRRQIALIAVLMLISFLLGTLLIPARDSKNVLILDFLNIGEDLVAKVGDRSAPNNGQLGPWSQTTSYPLFPVEISCVANGGYIYCVGGYNGTTPMNGHGHLNLTYYARLSSTGVGPWMRTTDYRLGIQGQSCVASSNYIYCVGGSDSPTHIIAEVYYASLSPSGIGPWTRTMAYPYPVSYPRCMTDSGYIYCVSARSGHIDTVDFYYAQLSASGVGSWTASPPPPALTAGCSASGGYAYCFGGVPCDPPRALNDRCSSPSYYAPLSPNGTRGWSLTTDMPTSVYQTYVITESYVYYFGTRYPGQPLLYFAHLSSNGIRSWAKTTPYPADSPAACVASNGYMYCIGGSDLQKPGFRSNNVYFTRVDS